MTPTDISTRSSSLQDKLHGCLMAGAIGDAYGYVVEFDSIEEILEQYGPLGLEFENTDGWADPRKQVIVSDDTQMTMFTAEACARSLSGTKTWTLETIVEDVRLAYLDWYSTQTYDKKHFAVGELAAALVMQARRAPGNTCMSACREGAAGTISTPINDSMGCGGVMRVAPLAFLPGLDDDGAWNVGCRSAALTHGHPMGYMPAGALVWLLRRLKDGQKLREAVHTLLAYLQRHTGTQDLATLISKADSLAASGAPTIQEIEELGGGWVGHECLAISLAASLVDTSLARKYEIAANHSGDSDSTAAVMGNILGAQFGINKIRGMSRTFARAEWNLDVTVPLIRLIGNVGALVR